MHEHRGCSAPIRYRRDELHVQCWPFWNRQRVYRYCIILACMSSCEYCISSSEYRCYDFDFIAKDDAVCRDDQYLNQTTDFPSCESCHIFCDGCSGPTYLNCVKCLDDTYPIKNTSDNCSCKENYTFSEYIEGFCECNLIIRYSKIIIIKIASTLNHSHPIINIINIY